MFVFHITTISRFFLGGPGGKTFQKHTIECAISYQPFPLVDIFLHETNSDSEDSDIW